MLKKLQRRFIGIAMFALSLLIMVQTFTVNAINVYQRDSEVRGILRVIADNNGILPQNYGADDNYLNSLFNPFGKFQINIETPYSTRYFVVKMKENVITGISTDHIAAVDDEDALHYADYVYRNYDPGFGFIDYYRYYYVQNNNRSMIVFLDYQKELRETFALASLSMMVSLITLGVILICVYWLSKKAMKPVADSIEKQKQFITDAGHELKTPLAIISADAEVLELCEGENEWLTSIKNQTGRMNTLVKNLVELTKLHEAEDKSTRTTFDISTAVLETVADFESRAKISEKDFTLSIAPNLKYYGNEAEIRQLVSILCDNAIKYTNEGGSIRISLYKSGKTLYLDAFNTVEYVDPSNVSRLFDRFYRADSSRSRETGGYGIGLSIAKAIVDRHKGKIKAVTNGTKEIIFKIAL